MTKKYNLKKQASDIEIITDRAIKENRNSMDISNEKQGVTEKNINLSLPVKNKDNTIPFNVQLDATRNNKFERQIIEARMDDKEVTFGTQKDTMIDINEETQKYIDKKEEAFKKAENATDADTSFWDKYVGDDLEGTKTTVMKNTPESASQLPNVQAEEIETILRDADAMVYHIYATAYSQGRDLEDEEKQQLVDIESGKIRYMASKMIEPVKRSLSYTSKE